jgi:hypothetical protein
MAEGDDHEAAVDARPDAPNCRAVVILGVGYF